MAHSSNGRETQSFFIFVLSSVSFHPAKQSSSFLSSTCRGFPSPSTLLCCRVPWILVSHLKRWKNKWADVLEKQQAWSRALCILLLFHKSWSCLLSCVAIFGTSFIFYRKLQVNFLRILIKLLFMLYHSFFFIRSWEFKIYCSLFFLFKRNVNYFQMFPDSAIFAIYVVYIFASLYISLSPCPSVFLYDDPQETIVAFQYICTWYIRQTVDSVNFTRKIAFQQAFQQVVSI